MSRDIESYANSCSICYDFRTRVDKSIGTWPKIAERELLHMDWVSIKQVGNVSILVDAGSGWTKAFICGNRSTENVIRWLSKVFIRCGVPR